MNLSKARKQHPKYSQGNNAQPRILYIAQAVNQVWLPEERQFHTSKESKIDIPWTLSVEGTGKYASTMRKWKKKEEMVFTKQGILSSHIARLEHNLSRGNRSNFDFFLFCKKGHGLGYSPLETQVFCGNLSNKDHEKDKNEK